MSTIIVPLDGLIRTDQKKPYMVGQRLYKALCNDYRIVIASPMSVGDTEDLLMRHGLTGWAQVREGTVTEVLRLERPQAHIHFVMTPDPKEAEEIFEQGVSVLTISGTDYVNPKWRPERRPWDEIVEEHKNKEW